MFFFIGGIQPKETTIDNNPRLCPSCGLNRAYYKRIDHYLSLFFIPILPVKKGGVFLKCDGCGSMPDEFTDTTHPVCKGNQKIACNNCGKGIKSDFKYCPFCGKLL